MSRSLVKCAVAAGLALWAVSPAAARSNPEDLLVDVTACFNTFVAEINRISSQHMNPGGVPASDKMQHLGEIEAARDRFHQCMDQALQSLGYSTASKLTFGFHHSPELNEPESVVFQFDNDFPAGDQVYLTVYNAGNPTGIENGSIAVNGVTVVDSNDLIGTSSLERPITLQAGTNELRITAEPAEVGTLTIVIDTHRYSPPN